MIRLVLARFASFRRLAYIHSKGIIHRDLKPDNVLVDASSTAEALEVKLSDFGHSKLLDGATRLTARIGTAMYWAPEAMAWQITDIYCIIQTFI